MAVDSALRPRGRGGVRIRTTEQVLFRPLCHNSVEEFIDWLSRYDEYHTLFDRVQIVYRPRREEMLADRMLFVRDNLAAELTEGYLVISSGSVYMALGLLQVWQHMIESGRVPVEAH